MKKIVALFFVLRIINFNTLLSENEIVGLPWWKTPPVDRRVEKTGQSFMFTRPIYQNLAAQNSSYWHDAVYEKIGCNQFSFEAVPMYQQTTGNSAAARYFLINQKNTLVIKGDGVTPQNPNDRDIRAEWLRLPGDYVGTFSLSPKQKQFGVWIELNQNIAKFICNDFFSSIWVAAAFPFQYVENNLQPKEFVVAGEGQNQPRNVIEALNDSRMCFGKISPKKQKRHSISELYFKLGTTFMNRNGFQIGAYSGAIFPTFGHQNPEFMFNPFLGHNRHFGFLTGFNFQFPLNCDTNCRLIALFFSIENQFFLRNYQHRTFDLRFKPWSRYMLFNRNDGVNNIPGVNILSPRCKVQPFNFVDLTAGFRVQAGWLEAEIGYNLWAHGDEEVKLQKPFPEIYGIAGDGTVVPGTNIGATASASTINNRAANDVDTNNMPTFVPIREFDLDFCSAIGRAAVAHRAHAALGFVHDQCTFALFWGIGGYVQIPQQNTSLWNWGAWGKVGGTF